MLRIRNSEHGPTASPSSLPLSRAKRLSGKGEIRPLEGLPITIKDSIITEGVRSTWGMKMFEHHVAKQDAPTVARLRAAGAIVIGKTNTPEFLTSYETDNYITGRSNNPWRRGSLRCPHRANT